MILEIATNESYWSWEDDIDIRKAFVRLDESTGRLTLEIIQTHIKSGLGAGKRTATIASASLGTLMKPKLRAAASILKKHSHDRTRSGYPFKRKWVDANGRERSLGDIVQEYQQTLQPGVVNVNILKTVKKHLLDADRALSELNDGSAEYKKAWETLMDAHDALDDFRNRRTAAERVAKRFIAIRFKQRREWYIPKNKEGVKKLTPPGTDLEMYVWEEGDKVYGMGFMGRQNKPFFNYIFRSERNRDQFIDKTIDDRKKTMRRKTEEKEERQKFRHDYMKGDILYSSWGYDQTNVDFYQVIDTTEKSIKIRQVGKRVVREERGSDYVVAVPGKFTDGPMTKRVSPGGHVKITSGTYAYKWDGKPKYETAMGWGH
jgi:hypothetical protein